MVQVVDPVQVLTPPRMLDELSGRVSQVAPAAINEHVRIWEKSVPPNAFSEYVRDFWQRSVLFLDILRERGNQHQEMLAHGVSSVLMYDSELRDARRRAMLSSSTTWSLSMRCRRGSMR